ncbi:MAG: hypothetical protein V7735_24260, partial [Photobacterium frigidiphilum]|uniref:hypothetical protein n=1 Tax=Photobacterium frigidiphilum TaxID=264736 RepID=UPI0030011ED6
CVDQEDVEFVNGYKQEFKYAPLILGLNDSCDIDISEHFDPFILDADFIKRIEHLIETGELPELIADYIGKCEPRSGCTIDTSRTSYLHAVTHPNEAVLRSLGYDFPNVEEIKASGEKDTYIDAIIDSSKSVLNELVGDKAPFKSDLIVYSPSIYTHLYNFKSNYWNQLIRKEKSKEARNFVMNGIFKNPNYSGFDVKINSQEDFNAIHKSPLVRHATSIRQFELSFTTAAIMFLSIANNCPSVRLPNAINLHQGALRDLESLSSSDKQNSEAKFVRKFKELNASIQAEIGEKLLSFIAKNSTSLTLCTDSPIDWVSFDRIPLMFTHELSKINTTPGNKLLQESTNFSSITLKQQDLMAVTVIRSFRDSDVIKPTLEKGLRYFVSIDNKIELKIIDVNSEQELIKALEGVNTSILIFDCHGNHGGSESHGWLQIGNDRVDTWKLPNVMPPIVILSACLTSALAGSHASVANGFLSRGAFTVLGTLLPVNAIDSSVFMGRILYRLSGYLCAIEKLGVEMITWREFMSGFFRMSFCTDVLHIIRDKYSLISGEQYKEIHFLANCAINSGSTTWYDSVLNKLEKSTGKSANYFDELIQDIGFVETMKYSQLGRPETIIIKLG